MGSEARFEAGRSRPGRRFDAHWDAIGAGVREGDVVNVVGTSTCIMAIAGKPGLIPAFCGVVNGSIHPGYVGIKAGLSATGDIFDAICAARRKQRGGTLQSLEKYRAGQTGLLAADLGQRRPTVLVNPELGA